MTEFCSGNRLAEEAGRSPEEPLYTVYVVSMDKEREEEFDDELTAADAYFDLCTELDKKGLVAEVELIERNYFNRSEWENEFDDTILLTNI